MATVLITGGTGLIGKALSAALLAKNHKVIILSRGASHQPPPAGNLSYASWDIAGQTIDRQAIEAADYIVHLAGAGVADKRWTGKRKKEIVDSRVKSGELIVKAMKEMPNTIKAVISSSAIGWYGPDPVIPNPRPFIENDPPARDFLGSTCKKWEESLDPLLHTGIRLVKIRTGIVVSREGGALTEFKRPLKFGLATILGSGRQVISWIHIDDLIGIYLRAIENEQMQGVYNAVAPQPVSNKTFILQLAKDKNKNRYLPVHVPAFVLKLVLGEMSIEVLKSATVSSRKIQESGFVFKHNDIATLFKES